MADAKISSASLAGVRKALADLGTQSQDKLDALLSDEADDIVRDVRSRVPYRTGRLARSYVARRTAIDFGGPGAPYAPWIEFGGRVGRNKSIKRPVVKGGRYLYPAIADKLRDIEQRMVDVIRDDFDFEMR